MAEAGSLALIMGPMFSGKTTELQRRIRRFRIARKRVLTLKYSGDTRYSEEAMATHDQCEMQALPVSRLADVPQAALDAPTSSGSMRAPSSPTCWPSATPRPTPARM